MKTILGNKIKTTTLGIVYICKYTRNPAEITVISELQFNDPFSTLEAYANITNPESQMAAGKTREHLFKELTSLHEKMKDSKWLEELDLYI